MLELFEHQKWKKSDLSSSITGQSGLFWNEDEIYEEFDILKNVIQEWWYKRYEISNFSAVGKSSVHNRVYREMEDYLWLWLSASSFINGRSLYFDVVKEKLLWDKKIKDLSWIRRTNTSYFPKYIWGEKLAESEVKCLLEKDYLIESFFLWLRTDKWVNDISKFESVLIKDYKEKINLYEENWFLKLRENGFLLTDEWMDCYNGIITELLQEI
jgi:oxygen-independent coproporphyrinogen-3 oxidase